MNRNDYVYKILNILSDKFTFQKPECEKIETEMMEEQITRVLKRTKINSSMELEFYEKLGPSGPIIPQLYSLQKVHLSGLPFCLILDMTGSTYEYVAKWVAELLDPLTGQLCSYSLYEMLEFINFTDNIDVAGKAILSLDVCLLRTNVPLNETV
ncbi:unnamed protein product [Trichobilharzia regenti]|nr:unnamed protein product [Trichobilharzia regenti]